MDKGVSYTVQFAAYPRYRHFQQHLQRMVDRWQKILDEGSLPDCISQGKTRLKEIMIAANQVDDKVKVNVFAEPGFLETRLSELVLQCNQKVSGETRMLSWTDFIEEDRKGYEPVITVIVLLSDEEKNLAGVKDQLSHLPKDLLKSIIIYFAETKTCVPYPELAETDFTAKDVGQLDSKAAGHSKSLNKQIQHLLEDNAISVLEQIAAYNKTFVPKKQEDLVESLENTVHYKLLMSLRNPFVVKDLSPDENIKKDEEERRPTDRELLKVAGTVKSNWETLGPSLGISQTQIADIKLAHDDTHSQIYNMMLLWQKREGARLKYLLQVMENVSAVIDVDMDVIKEIQEAAPLPKTDFERNEIFHVKLIDFVAKKTKCVICDKLTQKFGMSSSLVNEFLNEGFYGYEKKIEKLMTDKIIMPRWPSDRHDNGVSTCKYFSFRCCLGISDMITETEAYIKKKHDILMLLKKLQFQLYGLLEDTDVEIETKIPEVPKLPVDLQHELLEVPGVYGCGTLWGDLVIHVTTEFLPVKKAEVKNLMDKYVYMYGFRTEVIEIEREDAGGFTSIEHGNGIRTRKLNADEDEQYMYGSLGCFVNIKPKADKASNVVETETELHGLTCAHCVEACDKKIEIKKGENYVELGEKRYSIYEPHAFDVATLVINKTEARNCDTSLKNGNKESCKIWKVLDKTPLRMPVFKYGNTTGLTLGTCFSNDYVTKQMMENWNEKLKENNEQGQLSPVYNILISREDIQESIAGIVVEAEASPTEGQEPMQCDNSATFFSEPGDSGSVVCKDDPDNENVTVLSILLGSVRTSGETYSYSSHIYRTVEELQRRFDCIIQPAQ